MRRRTFWAGTTADHIVQKRTSDSISYLLHIWGFMSEHMFSASLHMPKTSIVDWTITLMKKSLVQHLHYCQPPFPANPLLSSIFFCPPPFCDFCCAASCLRSSSGTLEMDDFINICLRSYLVNMLVEGPDS